MNSHPTAETNPVFIPKVAPIIATFAAAPPFKFFMVFIGAELLALGNSSTVMI